MPGVAQQAPMSLTSATRFIVIQLMQLAHYAVLAVRLCALVDHQIFLVVRRLSLEDYKEPLQCLKDV